MDTQVLNHQPEASRYTAGFRALWLAFLLVWATFYHLSSLIYTKLKGAFTKDPLVQDHLHQVACSWAKFVFQWAPWWDIDLVGLDNIPRDGKPRVIVVNHESATDIFALYYTGLQFRWLAKASVFKIPIIGMAMRWIGYVPVHRGQSASRKEALESSTQVLNAGRSMLFFPEGTRSETGEFREFKTGAFRLAQTADVELLPVVLKGAGKLLRKGSIIPERAIIRMEVLPPVKPRTDEALDDLVARVRNQMIKAHKSA